MRNEGGTAHSVVNSPSARASGLYRIVSRGDLPPWQGAADSMAPSMFLPLGLPVAPGPAAALSPCHVWDLDDST